MNLSIFLLKFSQISCKIHSKFAEKLLLQIFSISLDNFGSSISGERCDKKITNIPYKPLTDRMLQEPFWLGLLTVIVVLVAIGLVWCARRHFPEKLEKLLAEEAERNRHCKAIPCTIFLFTTSDANWEAKKISKP